MYSFRFTIYTPAYNSGKTIHRVYESLIAQTYKNFEWLIINDGSKDDSTIIIRSIIKESAMKIQYIDLKENIGFNNSMNLAVKKARGEFFLIAHSDDEFDKSSLEIFLNSWNKLSEKQKTQLQGVKCNCKDQFGSLLGKLFPMDYFISDIFEILYKYQIIGEKWGFIKTDIMKEFPFPENKKFVPEGLIWNRIYYKYPALFINDILRVYYIDENSESLSRAIMDPNKYADVKRLIPLDYINHYFRKMMQYPIPLIKNIVSYTQYSLRAGLSISDTISEINNIFKKSIIILLFPLSFLIWKHLPIIRILIRRLNFSTKKLNHSSS